MLKKTVVFQGLLFIIFLAACRHKSDETMQSLITEDTIPAKVEAEVSKFYDNEPENRYVADIDTKALSINKVYRIGEVILSFFKV